MRRVSTPSKTLSNDQGAERAALTRCKGHLLDLGRRLRLTAAKSCPYNPHRTLNSPSAVRRGTRRPPAGAAAIRRPLEERFLLQSRDPAMRIQRVRKTRIPSPWLFIQKMKRS